MSGRLQLFVMLQALDQASGPFKQVAAGAKAVSKSVRDAHASLKVLKTQQSQLSDYARLRAQLKGVGRDLDAARLKQAALTEKLQLESAAHAELRGRRNAARTALKQQTQAMQKAAMQGEKASIAAFVNYDRLKRQLAALETETDKSGNALRRQRDALKKAETGAQRLTQQQARLKANQDGLKASLDKAGIASDRFGQRQRELRGEVARATRAIAEQENRARRLQKASERAAKLESRGQSVAAVGTGMAYTGARVVRAGALPVAAAMRFESAMADVRKVVDFENPGQFKAMGRDILDMSGRMPMAAEGIAAIVAAAGQANVARAELLGFAGDAVRMGVAFDQEAAEAGQTMATWRTAFRMNQDEVVALADKINYLGNTGPANVQKISAIVNRIGALGEVAGLGSGPVAALGATVAAAGIEDEIAATGVKNLMLTLTAGKAATRSQRAAFAALRLDAVSMSQAMQNDAGGAILTVLKRLQSLPKAAQSGVLTKLFGRESVGAIAPLLTNLELLETNFGKVGDKSRYAGSMQKEYEARAATSENATVLLRNKLNKLAVTAGTQLLPMLNTLADWAGRLMDRFSAWAEAHPAVAKGLLAVTIGGAALVTMIGALLVPLGMMAWAFGAVHNVVMLLSGGTGFLGLLKAGGGAIARLTGWVARGALSIIGTMARLGMALLANPVFIAVGLLAVAAYLIYRNWEGIKAGGKQLLGDIDGAVQGAAQRLGAYLKGVGTRMKDAFFSLPAQFASIGSQLMQGLLRGIIGMKDAVRDGIVGIAKSIGGRFAAFFGIRSPSRVFAGYGRHLMSGLAGGLRGGRNGPLAQVDDLAVRLRKAGAALALGTGAALPALAAAPFAIDSRGPLPHNRPGAHGAGDTYHISISVGGNAQVADVRGAVLDALAEAERRKAARSRSRLTDE